MTRRAIEHVVSRRDETRLTTAALRVGDRLVSRAGWTDQLRKILPDEETLPWTTQAGCQFPGHLVLSPDQSANCSVQGGRCQGEVQSNFSAVEPVPLPLRVNQHSRKSAGANCTIAGVGRPAVGCAGRGRHPRHRPEAERTTVAGAYLQYCRDVVPPARQVRLARLAGMPATSGSDLRTRF